MPFQDQPTLSALDLRNLLILQRAVISRDQLLRAGYQGEFGRNRVRAKRWRQVHPGVYLTNSGSLTYLQRCWAALLAVGNGAVLCRESAAYVHQLRREPPAHVHIVVPHAHAAQSRLEGVRMYRQRRPIAERDWPPRTSLAATTVDLADRASNDDAAVGYLTDGARKIRTIDLLREEVARRTRLRRRRLLLDLLEPAVEGIESTLEHRFDAGVLRAHRLPRPRRQKRQVLDGGAIRADAVFEEWSLRVELDGRIHLASTDEDVWRDNAVVIESGETTLRYRWRHVVGLPCRAAGQVARALRQRGWRGQPQACGPTCPIVAGMT